MARKCRTEKCRTQRKRFGAASRACMAEASSFPEFGRCMRTALKGKGRRKGKARRKR